MSNVTTTTTTGFAPQMQELGLAQAQNVMNLQQQPYQPYSTNPNAFAAPMNSTQVAGVQNINNAVGMAQPYIANATSTLGNYLGAGTAALGQSYNTINNAQNTGAAYSQAGMAGYQGAVQSGNAYNQAAAASYAGAPVAASGYNNMAGQGYIGAYNTAAPYTQTATASYAAAPGTSAPYNAAAGQGYLGAAQAAAPLNQAAIQGYGAAPGASASQNAAAQAGYTGAASAANPYNQTASQGYAAAPGLSQAQNAAAQTAYANAPGSVSQYNQSALQGYGNSLTAADPFNQAAVSGYAAAPGSSATQNQAAQAGYTGAASAANPYNQTAGQGYAAAPGMSAQQNAAAQAAYANAPGSVSQYNQSALQGYGNSLTAAAPLNQAAIQGYTGATSAADPYNLAAAQGYASAPGVATPYNQMATSAINNAVGAGSGYNQNAMANYTGGLAASMPYTLGGAQAVNAAPIDAAAINQYLSPFLNDVYKTTLAGQNVQNAQQSSALQGTAAQAGAFGGDRAGIAQANMAYQQNLANSQTNANLLNTGFTNALAAAQNQQNVNLGAQQANRAAQASTGQNIYNQMSNTGQNIAGLGQQVYGQNLGASAALSGLGNQMFGQQTAAAQGVGNIGQQIYGQKIGAAQGLGNMGQQISNQQINAAQGIGNIGQQAFGQQTAAAAGQLAAGNQNYNQAMGAAAGQANVGQQIYNQNAQTAAGQLAVGNQNYNQAMGAAQGMGNMGQQISNQNINAAQGIGNIGQQQFGQQIAGAAGQLAAGNQSYNQAMGAAAGQANVGNQVYNQGAQTAAGQLAVGNQNYNQAMGAAQGLGNMAQQTYGQGATTAAGLLGVGNQNYAQAMGAAQGIGAMGNQAFTQGNQTANSLAGLSNQTFNQQIASAQGLAGLGNQVYNQDAQAAQAALATGQNAFTQGATTAAQTAAIANSLNSMGLNAATTLGSLGGAAQTSALQGGQAQMTAGAVQQAIDQMVADKMKIQYDQSQAFPYTQASWGTNNLATIAGGLTPSTTTQTQQGGAFIARGGAIKPHARASGGLIPNAASEGGTVSMGRAGQGFADGGMPDPYMTNMYNILGSIYPNQNPAQPAGALAPSAPSGGFAPPPNGLPALYNGAQYAGNPFAALLNTASQVNPANYASANTAVKPETLAGATASGYNPSAFMAPKATKEPWWKPPEAAKPAAATDATAATGVGTTPTNSDANIGGAAVGGGNLMGALGLVNGDALKGAGTAFKGLFDESKTGLLDLLGLSSNAPSVLSQQNPHALDPAQKAQIAKDEEDAAAAAAIAAANPTPTVSMAPTIAVSQQDLPALDPTIDIDTTDLGLGGSGTIGGTGTGNNNSNPSEVPSEVNPGDNNGPSGNGDSGEGSGEGASGKYRGGLIRPHRREGGPVRKHYSVRGSVTTSGSVGIADSLYNNDPNSYGYIFGQGSSPASLDQNGYGSPSMNANIAAKEQSALQQAVNMGTTVKNGLGLVGDVLGFLGKFEHGGRVGRAGGGLVGRHGYEDGGGTGLSWRDGEDQTAYPTTNDVIIQPAPGDFSSWSARQRAAHPERLPANISFVPNRSVGMSPNEVGGIVPPERPPLASVPANTTRFGRLPGASFGYPVGETQYGFYSTEGEHALAEKANEAKLVNEQMLGGSAGGGSMFQPGSAAPSVTGPQTPTGGLMPAAPIDRGEHAYARDNNAGTPSVFPGIDTNAPPPPAPPVPGLLGGNGGANSAPNASSAVGAGSTGNAAAPFVQSDLPKGLIPAKEPSWLSRIANIISPDTSSETPKGSWIDRNKGWLDLLSLFGGGLAGMTGKRSAAGLVAGAISGAGAASQAVQKGIADRAKTEAETANMPARLAVDTRTQDQALLTSLLQRRSMFAFASGPERDLLEQQINALIAKLGTQATPGTPPVTMPTGQTQIGAAPAASGAGGADGPFSLGDDLGGPSPTYVNSTNMAESGNNPHAQNSRSTAGGAAQFLDGTFLEQVKKHYPDFAKGKSDSELLALKGDVGLNNALTLQYARENTPILRQNKLPVNDTTLRLMHSFGAGDGPRVMQTAATAPNTPMEALFPPSKDASGNEAAHPVLRANPSYAGRTVGQVANRLTTSMQQAPQTAAGAAQPAAPTQTAPQANTGNAAPHNFQPIGTAAVQVPQDVLAAFNNPQLNPAVTRFASSPANPNYNDATNPLIMLKRANDAAGSGNPTIALDQWKAAAAEINRMNAEGTFMGNDGKTRVLPGWLDAAAQKSQIDANKKYFAELADSQTKRSASTGVIGAIGDTLTRHETGAGMEWRAKIEGNLRAIGVSPDRLSGATSAAQVLQKEAANTAAMVGGNTTDMGRQLALNATVQPKNDPEANRTLYAQLKAANAYGNMRDQAAMAAAARSDSQGITFDPAAFARQWEAQNPDIMHRLVEEAIKTSPVRGIPVNSRAADGTQFVLEPGQFTGQNGKKNQNPLIAEMRNGELSFLRSVQ